MAIVFQLIILAIGFVLFHRMGWSYLQALAQYQPLPPGKRGRSGQKVYVEGMYSSGTILRSPIAQEVCLRWRVIVTEKQGKNSISRLDHGSYGVENFAILRRGDRRSFLVEQQPDTVLKQIHDLGGHQGPKHQYQQNLLWQSNHPQMVEFLQNNGINPENWLGVRRSLTVTELFWRTNDPIFVFGELTEQEGQWCLKAHLLSDQSVEKLRRVPSLFLLIGVVILFFAGLGMFNFWR
ncbi:hypothetical protein IQE94_14740 [Synechocystis sp. PCC 7339]|uniref:hypothetical protein n=1 Tax=unclassified Synechocystis TaxID=2640012 RepID=UPI001BAF5B9F|nr:MULTISPECIES: hypothetical protein [unclassified Synechocystis]QUS60238.1 hypothetical protein HTZ78_05820 [Synechocystis sp. PCC 7338]UAJ72317.1 hypothetical protein IQE94_14740 [Synechocystis sp. PCC 7339]